MSPRPDSSQPSTQGDVLVLADEHPACGVLGPGLRYALWVQGCPLRCHECVSPQWLPFDGGIPHRPEAVAERILAAGVEGLTLSGGEPFSQAAALVRLVDLVRESKDLTVLSFTGFTRRALERHGTAAQQALLERLDILVDGPYLPERHADLAWRGSANQRVHLLSDRHTEADVPTAGVGLQVEVLADATVQWLGVPVERGFLTRWNSALHLTPIRGRSDE